VIGVAAAHLPWPAVGWRPVLSGADGERALTWAVRLADQLRWVDGATLSPWLGDGAAGLAVLFATLAATLGGARFEEPTERYSFLAADRLTFTAPRRDSGLFSGLSGVAWSEEVVSRLRGDVPNDSDDVDELLGQMLAGAWSGPWELTNGLVGIGVYALERARTDPSLLDVVLARLAEPRSPWRRSAPAGGDVEVGMAHGVAGVAAFTALAGACGAAPAVLPVAAGALLARRPAPPSPPRWCCGDLGVAAALGLARPLLSHPLVPQALTAALHAVPAPRGAGVEELGLCHGVAGVAHVLHRLAVTNQSDRAWTAAAGWGRVLLDRLDSGAPMSGPGFLTGGAGVVLGLLSLATDLPPVWDRALLLS
jgi:lantibiotic modifying enzyme